SACVELPRDTQPRFGSSYSQLNESVSLKPLGANTAMNAYAFTLSPSAESRYRKSVASLRQNFHSGPGTYLHAYSISFSVALRCTSAKMRMYLSDSGTGGTTCRK